MDLEKFYDEYWVKKNDSVDYKRLNLVATKVNPGEKVLEVGGQVGLLAKILQEKGIDITITDISGVALKKAKNRGIRNTIKVDLDVEPLPFEDNTFDVVISSSSIEHVFYPEKMLSECSRVMKQGGKFILLVPNIGHFRFRWWLLRGRFPYILNTPTDELHIRFMTLRDAKAMCSRFNLIPESVDGNSGIWVEKLYPAILRKRYVSAIYNFLARKLPSFFSRDFILICKKKK